MEDWLEQRIAALQRRAFRAVSYRTRRVRRLFLRRLSDLVLWALKPAIFLFASIVGGSVGGRISSSLYPEYYGLELYVLCAAILIVASSPLFLMITIEQKMRRDLRARRLLFSPAAQDENITLLLRRHFSDTGMLLRKSTYTELFSFLTRFFSARGFGDQIDDVLFRALRGNSTVIKLSGSARVRECDGRSEGQSYSRRRIEDLGAGQIFLQSGDEEHDGEPEWLATVISLMQRARQIVIIPFADDEASLLDELRNVQKHDLLERVVMIMPPSDALRGKYFTSTGTGAGSVASLWQDGAKIIEQELSIKLPKYERKGGLVLLSNGQFTLFRSVDGIPWTSAYAIRRLLRAGIARSHRLIQSFRFAMGGVLLPVVVTIFFAFAYIFFADATPDFSSLGQLAIFFLIYTIASARFAYDWFRKFSDHSGGIVVAGVTGFALPLSCIAAELGLTVYLPAVGADDNMTLIQILGVLASLTAPAIVLVWAFSYFFMSGKQVFKPDA